MYHVISIHAPHEGERLCARRCLKCTTRFQSTLPTRGSDKLNDESHTASNISIHAPHEGERPAGVYDENCEALFQSTLPTRGSDVLDDAAGAIAWIFQSTLPTRGSDGGAGGGGGRKAHFNPRSPRGGATAEKCICMQHFREFTEYYPLRHGDACCIAPQDCIIQAFFGAKKRCFYVRLCFALKNKGVRG